MKKSELKALLRKLFIRNAVQENHIGFYKSMNKKELKEYLNLNGGFTKGKVSNLSFDPQSDGGNIPKGAFRFDAILSDESVNMNGYRILASAWQEGFQKYFDDYEGSVYLQHDMDQPIGKTLTIEVNADNQLVSTGYAYDDLTQMRISRGLVTDISTGHIPLEIQFINKDTNETKTPDEFYTMLWDMVDRMRNEGRSWEDIKQAIADLRELWTETHTKVQIVEYSFVSVGANTTARVRKINNTIDVLNEELPEDIEIENDEAEEVVEEEVVAEEEVVETQPVAEDATDVEEEVQPTEDILEEEGGTPEGSKDTTDDQPEIVEDQQVTELKAKITELETLNVSLTEQVSSLTNDKKKLEKDLEDIMKHNSSKKKVVLKHEVSDKTISQDEMIMVNNVKKLLKNG